MAKRPEMGAGLTGLSVNKGLAPPSLDREMKADPSLVDVLEDGPGLTLYLKRHSYEELKRLALGERTTVHALLVEGVAKVFESRNSAATALAGNRPGSAKRNTKKAF